MNCNTCESLFRTKAELAKHMKLQHKESVSTCRNYIEGKCEHDDTACWFVHGSEDKNDEVNEKLICEDRLFLERLVQMVEKLTK